MVHPQPRICTHVSNVLLAPAAAAAVSPTSLPRVLYVVNMHPAQKFGSMEEQIVFLSRAFEAERSRLVALFSCVDEPGLTDGLRALGVEAHCLDMRRFRLRTLLELWKLTRIHGIDIVHWNLTNPLSNAYLWGLNATRPGLRHFYTDHNSRSDSLYRGPTGWKKICKRLLLKRYEQVWCVSEFVQNSLAAQGTWSNLHCCLHFVNTDRFRPDAAARVQMRRQHGVETRFVVTVIAQLIADKGIDLVIRALTELPEKVVLWIVGAGAQAEELRALTGALGLESRVRFWGLQRQVEPFLQASDCFVLPSRWQEAAGLVVLEAQAAGLPVVASRIGGIPEYIAQGHGGFLFTPNDVPDLACQLRVLCLDPPMRERMAAEARLHALERFSVESRLPELLKRYRGKR
jgi:glycosyltransferase involved in cell wall biosynthesis